MTISVVICTYKRASSLRELLISIQNQSYAPVEVLIIDGSPDHNTEKMLEVEQFKLNLKYFSVPPEERGLTRQRNYGIRLLSNNSEIVSFYDDDVILEPRYLEILATTFSEQPDCKGVGGITTNERFWEPLNATKHTGKKWYVIDGFALKLAQKNYLRRQLGLFTDVPPGWIPTFGHGYDMIPPSGKIYPVEHIVGCNMSFSRDAFDKLKFSNYFIGYGLYEDLDFSFRVSKTGKLYINSNLRLEHHHHPSGRPDTFNYGKMVTRNGWYVWRLKYPNPALSAKIKWYAISLILTFLLLSSFKKKSAWNEFFGRINGLVTLQFAPPKVEY